MTADQRFRSHLRADEPWENSRIMRLFLLETAKAEFFSVMRYEMEYNDGHEFSTQTVFDICELCWEQATRDACYLSWYGRACAL